MAGNLSRATKICRVCTFKMEKSARICPACETTQRPGILTGIIGLLVIFAVFGALYGVVFAAIPGSDSENPDAVSASSSMNFSEQGEVSAAIGDVIRTEQFEIAIDSIEEKQTVGTKYIQSEAPEGFMYLVVTWSYKGIADRPIDAFPSPSLKLQDRDRTENDPDISASGSYASEVNLDREVFSDLIPGVLVKDAQVFEVSKEQFDKDGWRLRIKADKNIFITLKK